MPPRKLTDFVEPTILPPLSKLVQRSNLTEPTMNNTPQLEVIKPMRRPRVSTLKVPTNLDTGPLSGGASHPMIGSGMSAPLLKQFIDYSYLGNTSIAPAGYDCDNLLSDSRVKVYTKDGSKEVVVTHRGSVGADDWMDNARYMVTGKVKGTKTYNLHRDRHIKAINKYGASNIIAIGHSRAGLYLQELQKEFPIKENITYNKASGFHDIGRQNADNQTDVRVGNDVVSLLAPLQRRPNKIVKIEGTKNPFDFNAAHQTGEINKVGDQFIGQKEGGVIKRKRGAKNKVAYGSGAGASIIKLVEEFDEEHLNQLQAEFVEVVKSIVNKEEDLRTNKEGLASVIREINKLRRRAEHGKRKIDDDDDIEFLLQNKDAWQDDVNADIQALADLENKKKELTELILNHPKVIGGNCGEVIKRKRGRPRKGCGMEGGFNNKQLTKVILDKNKVIGDLEEKAYGKDKFSNKQLTKIILDKNKVIGDLEETAYGGGTLPVISSVEGLKRLIATEQARLRKIKKGYKYESPTMSQEKIEEKIARLKERLKSAKANKGHADVSYFIPKSIKWLKIMAGETRVGSNAYNKLLLEAIKKLLVELSGKKPTAVNKKKTATLEEDRTNLEKIISPRPDANKPAPVIIQPSGITNERASIRAAVQREKTYNKIVDDKQQEDIKVILKAMIPEQPLGKVEPNERPKEDQRKERAREAARRQRERDKPSGFTQAQQYNKSSKQRQTKAKQYGVPTREYTASIKRSEQIEQELERESDEDKKTLIREERNKLRAKYTYLDEIMNSDNTDANRTNVASMGALPTIVEPEVEPPLAGSGMYGGSMCGGGSKYIITPKTEEYNLLN